MADPTLLRDRLLAVPDPVFAVLDGAQFDALPDALLVEDFESRCLYLDRGGQGPDFERNAPHLVWLDGLEAKDVGPDRAATLDALLSLIGDRPAAVFWVCPDGGDALFKHLRTINMVRVPADTETGKGAAHERLPESAPPGDPDVSDAGDGGTDVNGYELVTFRHADANVMAQVLPALDSAGFARLFGPATVILFAPDEEWGSTSGVMVAPKPDGIPTAPSGPLTLDKATIGRVESGRRRASCKRVAAYLRSVASEQTAEMSDAEIEDATARYMDEARGYGVESEAARGRWCYLQVISGGALTGDPGVRSFMTTSAPGVTADDRVRILLQESARELAGGQS